MADDAVIDVRGLVKRFGRFRALDGLDLRVERGEVHGFLGPNGAGKSTTIRVLLGLLRADGGTARLLGGDPWRDAVELHRRLAYVPGDVAMWPNLSGGEAIDLLARMRGGIDERRRSEMVERFQLDPTKRFDTYSKGNRQKVALVAALSSRVDLYVFDEPSSGLDPLMVETFERCVRELADDGASVLLSSHVLAEVEALCERVTIIRDGRAIENGRIDDMRHVRRTTIEATTAAAPDGLDALDGVHDVRVSEAAAGGEHDVHLLVDPGSIGPVLELLSRCGVRSLTSQPPSLEELFTQFYEHAGAGR
jgi:ABC-2 type transport system ATP-binding protein